MAEIKCPNCGKIFKIDDADYASIVSQIKNEEMEKEINFRVKEKEENINKANQLLIKENDDTVSISVEDNGVGISKDDQEFIFNRFEQGSGFNSTKVSSSGIGLTLVKHIVELHNGDIKLESELEKGSSLQ